MLDTDYSGLSGRARVIEREALRRVRLPDGRVIDRWVRIPAVAVDIGRAPGLDNGTPDLPQSDIIMSRRIRAAVVALSAAGGGPISINKIGQAIGGVHHAVIVRHVERDPALVSPPVARGDRRAVVIRPEWRDLGDVDPDPCRWALDGVIRWFRDVGKPGTAYDVAEYSALHPRTVSAFFTHHSGLFLDVDLVDRRLIRTLTKRARALLLPALLAAVVVVSALLLPAGASAQRSGPASPTPRPTPARRVNTQTGGRTVADAPRCRWDSVAGRYQCGGSRYGRDRSVAPTPRPRSGGGQ